MTRQQHSAPHSATAAVTATVKKPRLTRETLKQLDARPRAGDGPRHGLTAKCVTFSIGTIRGRNAA
jgi:hypothetical protein